MICGLIYGTYLCNRKLMMKQYYILLFLYVYSNTLKADFIDTINNEAIYANYRLLQSGDGYIYTIPKECSNLLDAFAESASNFTMCSLKNAKPIRLCEKCVDYYKDFSEKYKNLTTKIVNGTSCKSVLISHDRLEVVLEYYNGIMSLWSKGNCNACFDWTKQPVDLSNNVKHFNQMYNGTKQCIEDHLNSLTNYSEICEQCMQNYVELDNFYNNMSTDSVGLEGVCMDVVDSMNATRYIWSKTLGCCKLRQSPQMVFLVCTGIIAFLPLIFYLGVRFCGPIRDLPIVLKRKLYICMLHEEYRIKDRLMRNLVLFTLIKSSQDSNKRFSDQ